MFIKGLMKDKKGIDITLKNSPEHFLAPEDEDLEIRARFGLVSPDEYKKQYLALLKKRWESRKAEFIELAKQGISETIFLRCYCLKKSQTCHSYIAAEFMNGLIEKLPKTAPQNV